jgi:Rps23 Pro-64 3,4-dihydroxylase Tpa1-like proline 4-hydroxylase
MSLSEMLFKVTNSSLEIYPFPYFLIEDSLSESDLALLLEELKTLEKTKPTSKFDSDFGQKKEWKSFPSEFVNLNEILSFLGSEEFINMLKLKFKIDSEVQIYPDFTYDGGGYVISPPGSFLGYHADFNFSSVSKMYRVLNILLYMNQGYSTDNGGELHLLDSVSKTVERRVSPKAGTLLGFFTDDVSFHGVSKNNDNFFRRSFNLYYYCATPISANQSIEPHKTIWVETKNHHH